MGKEKADKFIVALAAMKPLLVPSLTPAGERITTGETPIGIAFLKNVVFYGRKGVPLDYVRLGKFMGDTQSVSLAANGWATVDITMTADKRADLGDHQATLSVSNGVVEVAHAAVYTFVK